MARFCGKVGYGFSVETATDVYSDEIVERDYIGDVTRAVRKLVEGEGVNDNVLASNVISIVADAYAVDNFLAIRFVEWVGTLWTVDSVEVKSPRLLLTLGDVYNGPRAGE